MPKLKIKKLNINTEVNSEHLSFRCSPDLKNKVSNIANVTNRDVASVLRTIVEWAINYVEVEVE